MKRYRVSPEARDDLKRISLYIAAEQESPLGANRLRERFLDCFQRLAESPFTGQACSEFGESVRIWPVENYVALYMPQDNGIDIIQVAHGARDLPAVVRRPAQ